ncbi:CPXCG motif-containing cysteine-rich protein [bacterium]|nr:CPXCG motif-containing cysteine-rich protein [bacterium]
MQEESSIECPFCGEEITILVDVSVRRQNYIEDCSVCCRPIQLEVFFVKTTLWFR